MITTSIRNISLQFHTKPTLFSPNYIDAGTLAMLSLAEFSKSDKVLDLGCGYGAVGIYAAKIVGGANVTMTDMCEDAIEIAKKNTVLNGVSEITVVRSDGFNELDDAGFTIILSNPPYHTDFSVAKHFIEKGFNRLKIGGIMLMVTKREKWYKNKFTAIFGGVSILENDGYYVFKAEKRSSRYFRR